MTLNFWANRIHEEVTKYILNLYIFFSTLDLDPTLSDSSQT